MTSRLFRNASLLQQQAKAALPRTAISARSRATRLVCQARYAEDAQARPSRGSRKNSGGEGDGNQWYTKGKGARRGRDEEEEEDEEVTYSEDISGRVGGTGAEDLNNDASRKGPQLGLAMPSGGRGELRPRREGEEGGARSYGEARAERPTYRGPREGMSYNQMQSRSALNQAVKDATNWRTIAAFIDEKGSLMDAENVCQILYKMSFRPIGRTQQQGYNPDNYERPRDAASAQEYDQLLSTLLGWVLVLMPKFRPKQVASCLMSLSKMELWNEEVIGGLVQISCRQMVNFEPSDYGNMMWAFAKFNYSPGEQFFTTFMEKTTRKLAVMSAADLGRTAAGMSKIGCVPSPQWVDTFWKVTGDKARDFSGVPSGDIFMAVAYFAQAGMQPPQEWVDVIFGSFVETEPAKAARMAHAQKGYHEQVAQAQGDGASVPKPQVAERPLPKIPAINKVLYTLSNLTAKPNAAWFAAVVEAWRRQFRFCSPSDIGNICLYLGRYLQVPINADTAGQLLRETMKQQEKMKADELAAVAFLLATSQFKGFDRDIDDFVYVIKQQLPNCSLAGLEMVYNALPSIGSGYRLNEAVAEAASRYNDMLAAQQAQQPAEIVGETAGMSG